MFSGKHFHVEKPSTPVTGRWNGSPVQLQAGHPVPLIGLLLAKTQQGKTVAQGFVGDSVLEAHQHMIETTRFGCSWQFQRSAKCKTAADR